LTAPVVLYGATGFTGRLVARELLARGGSVVLAGRSPRALADRRDELLGATGLACERVGLAVAPLDDAAALRAALSLGSVVIHCAGPYAHTGAPVLQAAIDTGTHYLDSTGEQDWIKRVFDDYGDALAARGIAAVPGFAFSHAPGDLLAHVVGTAAAPVRQLTVAYHVDGFQMSRGTTHSALEQLNGRDVAYEHGAWIRGGGRALHEQFLFPAPLGRRRVARYPVGDVITIPRHVPAQEVRARITTTSMAPRLAAPLLPFATPLLARIVRGPLKPALERVIERLPEGPTDESRGRVRWTVAVAAIGEDGHEVRGSCTGPDIYGFTGHALAEGALQLSRTPPASGALAPAQAVDAAAFLDRMAVCGVSWQTTAAVSAGGA
jgi:short subunit dehydrogenase-like uncharacterized protein